MSRGNSVETRASLIRAAHELFHESGFAGVSVDDVVNRAGLAKGTFYIHFKNRASFLTAIHRDFHERLKSKMLTVMRDHSPGFDRIEAGLHAYLDGCLSELGVKALLFEARSEDSLREEVLRRNAEFTKLVATDFRAMRRRDPAESARLFIAMGAETALAEMQAGKKLPSMRRALLGFIREP